MQSNNKDDFHNRLQDCQRQNIMYNILIQVYFLMELGIWKIVFLRKPKKRSI